ncbi:hypothetical protein CPB84DRAFT_1747490 [Gymnopilus junonius]|uniref:Uncharacterized protein n=1 Tax=Gymnopilus junonius TaxID=109634 RepID=A0A9P5NQ73_GYMJU|nr:hypothetical protein CPB84DRAFT_1747490 [Gymnopilus junonius]
MAPKVAVQPHVAMTGNSSIHRIASPDFEIVDESMSDAAALKSPSRSRGQLTKRPLSVKVVESPTKLKAKPLATEYAFLYQVVQDSDEDVLDDEQDAELEEAVDVEDEELGDNVNMDDEELDEDLDPDDDSDLKDFIVDDDEDIDETLLDEASDPEEAVALSHGDTMYPDTPVPSRIVGSRGVLPLLRLLLHEVQGQRKLVLMPLKISMMILKCIFNVASLKTSPDKSKAIHLLDTLEKEMDDDSASNALNVSEGDQPKEPDVRDNEKEVDLHGMGDGEAMPNVNTSKQKISKTSSKQKTDVTPVKKKSTVASQKKMSAAANVPKGSASFDLSSLGKKVDGEPSSVEPVKVAYKKDCLLVKELPSVCAFANSEDKSEVMKQNGLYDNLPNLSRVKILVSLKDVQPYGLPTIDGVYHSGVVNNFDVNRALNALTFVRSGCYVNIACAIPWILSPIQHGIPSVMKSVLVHGILRSASHL